MKHLLSICFALLLLACSTDPMDRKYTTTEKLKSLESLKPPIDPTVLGWIKDAEATNERNGVSNEEYTLRELKQQGIQLYAERKTKAMVDSITYKVESEVRNKAKR